MLKPIKLANSNFLSSLDVSNEELNHIILSRAMAEKQRPKSVSAFVRELIQKEIRSNSSESETE